MNKIASYNFDLFDSKEKSLENIRLKKQAGLAERFDIPLLTSLGIEKYDSLLDLGCGHGYIASDIAKSFTHINVHAIDHSESILKFSEQFHQNNLFFRKASIYDTKYQNNFFDMTYSRLVFQHLLDPLKAMEEAIRVTRPYGKICIVDIDDDLQIFYPDLPKLNSCRQYVKQQMQKEHGDRFIGKKLPHIMQSSGLKNIRVLTRSFTSIELGNKVFFDIACSFLPSITNNHNGITITELEQEITDNKNYFFGMVVVMAVIGEVVK